MGKHVELTRQNYRNSLLRFVHKNYGGWLILLPSILLFLFFIWIPLFNNISLSFYKTVGFTKVQFIGFQKYVEVFHDPAFLTALGNTMKYTLWSLVIGFLVPIILAMILNEVIHFKSLFKIAIYFPNIVPGLAVVIMWTFLMDPDPHGVLNSILSIVHVSPFNWLDNSFWVIPLIVLTLTWKGAGATTLIYYAVLQGIDTTQYEAARIEGASTFQRIRYVTLPHLMPTIRMLFILQIISVFQVFYEPLVMTDGGPNNASLSLLELIYNYLYSSSKIDTAKAAALGVIVAMMLLILTGIYLKLTKSKED